MRVSRASITPTGPVDMGRPMIGPDVCLNRSYSRGVLPAGTAQIGSRPGSGRPAVTISDPLGGTLMLNPNSVSSGAASLGTRIQVGPEIFSYFLSCLMKEQKQLEHGALLQKVVLPSPIQRKARSFEKTETLGPILLNRGDLKLLFLQSSTAIGIQGTSTSVKSFCCHVHC